MPPHWLVHFFSAQTSTLTVSSMWLADITIVATGIAFFFMANLFASRLGRSMRLVRDNEVAAELVGVSLPRARVIAFVVSSAYAALGGGLWTLINNSVSPPTFSLALSITILSLVVIGGIGTLQGAIIGGVIYACVDQRHYLVHRTCRHQLFGQSGEPVTGHRVRWSYWF